MDTNELVNFNPILGNAFAQAEKESAAKGGVWGEMIEYLREFVALGVKTGGAVENLRHHQDWPHTDRREHEAAHQR